VAHSNFRSVIQLLVTANIVRSSPICHPDDGGDRFLRNVGSYKSNTAQHPRRRHFFVGWIHPQSCTFTVVTEGMFVQQTPMHTLPLLALSSSDSTWYVTMSILIRNCAYLMPLNNVGRKHNREKWLTVLSGAFLCSCNGFRQYLYAPLKHAHNQPIQNTSDNACVVKWSRFQNRCTHLCKVTLYNNRVLWKINEAGFISSWIRLNCNIFTLYILLYMCIYCAVVLNMWSQLIHFGDTEVFQRMYQKVWKLYKS
jgi:hypothetical protein